MVTEVLTTTKMFTSVCLVFSLLRTISARETSVYDRDQFSVRKYPFMVNVRATTGAFPTFRCGGVLINPKFVVVPAHCIAQCSVECIIPKFNVFFVYGGTATERIGRRVLKRVEKYYIHPQYQERNYIRRCDFHYDIALLQLQEPFRFSRKIAKVILPDAVPENSTHNNCETTNAVQDRRRCTAVGWYKGKLKEWYMYLVKNHTCSKHHAYFRQTGSLCWESNICTSTPDNQTDPRSAEVLLCDNVMLGLYSGASSDQFNVYTRMDVCRKWIDDVISSRASNRRIYFLCFVFLCLVLL